MAAPCKNLVRATIQGLQQLSNNQEFTGFHLLQRKTCPRFQDITLQSRSLHFGHYSFQSMTSTQPQKVTTTQRSTEPDSQTKKGDEDEDEDNRPEYIPKRKAKNPLMKIGYAWMIGLPTGIIGFALAKRQVDKNRLKQLKIRQRMKKANEGEYERERYTA